MAERSRSGTEQTLSRLALAGALGLAAVALGGCATTQPGSVAPPAGAGSSLAAQGAGAGEPPSVRDLMAVLTRSGVGPDQVALDLTYAPPLFFEVTGLEPPAEASARPTLAFMLEETVHEGALPDNPPTVFLMLDSGDRASPYDVKVTATDPHHRTTRLLFADPGNVSAASEIPGHELALTLVVPFTDGTVSAGNTFVWQLPINVGPAAPSTSPGASE